MVQVRIILCTICKQESWAIKVCMVAPYSVIFFSLKLCEGRDRVTLYYVRSLGVSGKPSSRKLKSLFVDYPAFA